MRADLCSQSGACIYAIRIKPFGGETARYQRAASPKQSNAYAEHLNA